jgi:serine/threonine-protein kinase RsbW
MTAPQPQVHVAIASRLENIEVVQVAIEASLGLLSLEEATAHRIGLAVREAVANAIKHGNREDPEKTVEVDCILEPGRVLVRIEDEGDGFDPAAIPDPLLAENLLKPTGRGVFFMNEFMDEIDYTFRPEGGTIVTMKKNIAPAVDQAAPKEKE